MTCDFLQIEQAQGFIQLKINKKNECNFLHETFQSLKSIYGKSHFDQKVYKQKTFAPKQPVRFISNLVHTFFYMILIERHRNLKLESNI